MINKSGVTNMKKFNSYEHVVKYIKRNKDVKIDEFFIEDCKHEFKLKSKDSIDTVFVRKDREDVRIYITEEKIYIDYQFHNRDKFTEKYEIKH